MVSNTDGLTELQKHLVGMLKVFSEYCDNHEIEYYLIAGSLIGAVRHKGFIPWDDDIDIGMPRPAYEKLLKSQLKELPDNLAIRYGCYEPGFTYTYAKLVDKNTTLIESEEHHIKYGVYIDIFPFDGCGNSFFNFGRNYYRFLGTLAFFNNNQYENTRKKFDRRIVQLLARRMNKAKLFDKLEAICTHYSYAESKYIANYSTTYGLKAFHKKEWYSELTEGTFNGVKVKIPVGYDSILRAMYGEYMRLPPKEKQVSNHSRLIVDLHKPYSESD